MERCTFITKDGLKLAGIWHVPKQKTSKAIILAHGITVDKNENGLFITLSKILTKKGYAVLRFDFQGHGESKGNSVDLTVTGKIHDLEASLKEVKNNGYHRIGLLGASFGGGTAALFTSKHQKEIACLCLWNPVLNYDHTFLHPTLPWIRDRKNHMKKELKEKGWTTLGKNNFVLGRSLFNDMQKFHPFRALKNITIPTVIIHGTNDMKVPYEDSKKYTAFLSHGILHTIPNAGHGFHTEKEAKEVLEATIRFFQVNL